MKMIAFGEDKDATQNELSQHGIKATGLRWNNKESSLILIFPDFLEMIEEAFDMLHTCTLLEDRDKAIKSCNRWILA